MISSNSSMLNEFLYRRSLFEEKFTRAGDDECWEWNAGKVNSGAGVFRMGPLFGGSKPAHAASWFFYVNQDFNSDIKPRFFHKCGNNGCVNPNHIGISGNGSDVDKEVLHDLSRRYPHLESLFSQIINAL